MKPKHALELVLTRGLWEAARAVGWRRSLAIGTALGDSVRRMGLRRRVADANLARAFPERSEAARAAILDRHYRELGRVAVEYTRLADLVRAPAGEVVASVRGLEHLEAAKARGRGVILLTGHFGNFELLGAYLGQMHPVDFVVRPLTNPGVEALIAGQRDAAGVGLIRADRVRGVYESLRANRWVSMLADQDARAHGVFVPFFGRPTSTPIGPARIALATGAPIVMGWCGRDPDGRHTLEIDPPIVDVDPRRENAAERLTAMHTARLEERIREHPESWFWLHRRWKTAPPGDAARTVPAPGSGGSQCIAS